MQALLRTSIILAACFLALPSSSLGQETGTVDFSREVKPILSDYCFACHGPDEAARQAGLRLDTREGAFADRDGRPAVVPGSAEASLIYQRMSHAQEVARMPPPAQERQPTEGDVETIRRWIEQGAGWETHWAYDPPRRPGLPDADDEWAQNPVDRFVAARLDRENLTPAAEADRRTLLRRLSFDLTGLPPTASEIAGFLGDTAPDAYEKQVDRLLASPRYGERMAMQWLDLARYADTHGYHIDSHRDMWIWRDWVIRAFNDNKPFDEFTVEQLAGDLLPNPSEDQLIATAFNRNHMINYEGGAIPEEYHAEYVVDRVDTTATVWMAMTMGCARCHDHKYDPISQRDFYRFYAFFNSIDEKGLDGVQGNAAPVLLLPDATQRPRIEEVKARIAALEEDLGDVRIEPAVAGWADRQALKAIPAANREGLEAHYEMEGSFVDSSGRYRHGQVMRGEPSFREGPSGQLASFDVDTHVALTGTEAVDLSRPFSIAFWMRHSGLVDKTLLHKMDTLQGRRGLEVRLSAPRPIPDTLTREFDLTISLSSAPGSAIEVKALLRDVARKNNTYHVALSYDGSGRAAGLSVYLNGELADRRVVLDALEDAPTSEQPFEIGAGRFGARYTGSLDDLRIYSRELHATDLEQLYVHEPIRALLGAPKLDCESILAEAPPPPEDDIYADETSDDVERCLSRQSRLTDYYLTYRAAAADRDSYRQLVGLRAELEGLKESAPSVMVMQELEESRDTYLMGRGDYRNLDELVEPATPAWLNAFPEGAPLNRLGLAQWLVSRDNPLTARVTVNRFWQMYFGTGLVRTSEDFGSQGEAPTHPKLLDWLAVEFIESGWDVKALQKRIVMSATYRQRSNMTPRLLERDPENRLLAVGPRFRLPAEMVRDNALFVAGLLSEEMGGPSVFPYQPEGIWEEISYGDYFTAQVYNPSSGEDVYRRSVYSFWKRTAPPPSLAAFDAPDREKCTARRPRTNTPLQALVLMNDPTFVEAARALAEKLILESEDTPAERVRYAFLRAVAREPRPEEVRLLVQLAQDEGRRFASAPHEAAKLIAVGESTPDSRLEQVELATWTTVASAILNLDETITKE